MLEYYVMIAFYWNTANPTEAAYARREYTLTLEDCKAAAYKIPKSKKWVYKICNYKNKIVWGVTGLNAEID